MLVAVLFGNSISATASDVPVVLRSVLARRLSFSAAVAVVEMCSMMRSSLLPRMYPVLTAALRETWEAQSKVFTSSQRTGWAMVSSGRRRTHTEILSHRRQMVGASRVLQEAAGRGGMRQAGIVFEEVPEADTTQTCSCCGDRPNCSPKGRAGFGIREWTCSACGTVHDRDVNAARNIFALGQERPGGGLPV